MKKSWAYHMAQLSVLADELISKDEKLDILRVLQAAEAVAKFSEQTLGSEEE